MKAPYALIPISILALLLYLLSYTASRLSIIKIHTHRKIWNIVLLLTFLTTACLGIVLAVQVNYKINIRIVEKLLVWHVDFGIGMAMIALFHFSWHLKYYLDVIRKPWLKKDMEPTRKIIDETEPFPDTEASVSGLVRWTTIALGLSAVMTQIILLREFMSLFYGNELVLGIILANWMILTGLGSFLGKYSIRIRNREGFIFFSLVLIGILPILTVFLLNTLKNIVFIEGSIIGLPQVFAWSGLMILPYCLLSGFLFTLLCHHISTEKKANLIGKIYSLEAIGSIMGGILFSFVLVFFLKTFQSLAIMLTIDLAVALVFYPTKRKVSVILPIAVVYFFILLITFVGDLDKFAKQHLFRNQEIVFLKETPYGNLTITKTGDQLNYYENYVLLFNTLNTIANEEAVHYAMVQHPAPRSVLLVSGGVSGMLDEILKYPVDRIDYLEINPALIRAARQYQTLPENNNITIYNQDARLYVQGTVQAYDIVLLNLPPPGSAQINRFYTREFFQELHRLLNPSGIVCLGLPSTINYMSEEALEVNSIIFNTLQSIFLHVDIIPGEKNIYLASDAAINLSIAGLIEEKGIQNEYVNQYYIDDQLLTDRRNIILNALDRNSELNYDFVPRAYLTQISYWLSFFDLNYWILWIPLFCLILFLILRRDPLNFGMFAGGFAASSIEILLLIIFQIVYGYLYHVTGIIITLFMAGLAIGPILRKKIIPVVRARNFIFIQSAIGIFAIILPLFFLLFRILDPASGLVHLIIFFLTLTISVLTGIEFSLASVLQKGNILQISSGIYSADLIGSAIGALLVSALLIPYIGIINVALIIGGFNLLAAAYTWIKRRNFIT